MKKAAKFILPVLCAVMLTAGNVLSALKINTQTILNGYTTPVYTESISAKGVLDGTSQQGIEAIADGGFPLRSYFVKAANQIKYSLFNTSSNSTISLCKNNALIETGYINEYLGLSEIMTDEQLAELMQKLETANELCKQNGKEFMVVITPNKLDICPDILPDNYAKFQNEDIMQQRNYYRFAKLLSQSDILYTDGVATLKNYTGDNELFALEGVHWNELGGTLTASAAVDTLNKNTNLNLRPIEISEVQHTDVVTLYDDLDLYRLLNIYSQYKTDKFTNVVIDDALKITQNKDGVAIGPYVQLKSGSYTITYYGTGLENAAPNVTGMGGQASFPWTETSRTDTQLTINTVIDKTTDKCEFTLYAQENGVTLTKIDLKNDATGEVTTFTPSLLGTAGDAQIVPADDKYNTVNMFLCGGSFERAFSDALSQSGNLASATRLHNNNLLHLQWQPADPDFASYNDVDLNACLADTDLVVFEVNVGAIYNMCFGFIDVFNSYVSENGFPEVSR